MRNARHDGQRPPEHDRPRVPRPRLPEDVDTDRLDRSVWRQLRTLSEENAQIVAAHLVAVADLLHVDEDEALAHGLFLAARAGRVPAVREALGLVRYARGEWAEALKEFRTVRRMSGSDHLLPHMADCERGLGRPERALDLVRSPEAERLGQEDRVELAIVGAGARTDLGQTKAAVLDLRALATRTRRTDPWAARLYYAYAAALLAEGQRADAGAWFERAERADAEGLTEAYDRLVELGLREPDLEVVDAQDPLAEADEDEDGAPDLTPDDTGTGRP